MSIPPEKTAQPETEATETEATETAQPDAKAAETEQPDAKAAETAQTETAEQAANEPVQGKRTSIDLRSAGVPVLVVVLLSLFIVYPYAKELFANGPQPIITGGRAPDEAQAAERRQDAIDLLGAIKPNAEVKGFKVLSIRGPRKQRIEIEFGRGEQVLRVFVSRIDSVRLIPPRTTQMYAIYYESAKPDPDSVTSEEYLGLVEEVGKVVEQNERKISMPDGL